MDIAASRRIALALGVVAVVTSLAHLGLRLGAGAGTEMLQDNSTSGSMMGIGYGLAGLWIVRARPRNAVGWLLLLIALVQALNSFAYGWATWPDPLPGLTFAAWWASWTFFLGFGVLPTVLVALYPTGRAGPGRRRLVGASLVGTCLVAAALALAPDAIDDVVPGLENPVAVPALTPVLAVAGAAVLLPCVLLSLIDAGRRLWRGVSPEREQLAWLLTAVVICVGVSYVPIGPVGQATTVLVPLAVAVGVLRHRLLDLQVVVRRTMLFTALTGLVVAVFAVTTAALSAVVRGDSVPVTAAAALVAVGLIPAKEVLQRGVDRLVYGERRDPLRAVASLSREVAQHDDAQLLPQVLRTVAAAVRSPHVALYDVEGSVLVETGTPTGLPATALPLQVGGRTVGCLAVAPRTVRDGWSADDRRLLELLASQVAVVAHAAALNADLAASRDRVLTAAADERRRLHHELHDGLGPALSGIALGLEAAEAALERDQERTAALLSRLRQEAQGASREVRHLVDGLRPTALDDQTLDGALATFVAGLSQAVAERLDIGLDAAEPLPLLDPDVEAAAYRITTEALTNVVRHSGATTCRVSLGAHGSALQIVVEDDGVGLPAQPRDGVGLVSMRRRAAELGGTWSVGPRPGGGTLVRVSLPVAAAEARRSAAS